MSVAFTREEDSEAAAADLPDRPISPHPNLVTPSGLVQLEAKLARAKAEHAAAQAGGDVGQDRTAMARTTRDLRYYSARRASAQRVDYPVDLSAVRFGAVVRLLRADGREGVYRIVGEDEADPAAGRISYVSPLARAFLGRAVGWVAEVGGGEVELLAILPAPSA